MKLRQATHAVFTVGVACLFLYGERWKIKMDLQYATTTTGECSLLEKHLKPGTSP